MQFHNGSMQPESGKNISEALADGRISKVLAVCMGRVGDVLFTTPAIRRFKEKFPRTGIFVLTTKALEGFFEHHPLVEKVLTSELHLKFPRWWTMGRVSRRLRAGQFDLALGLLLNRRRIFQVIQNAGIPRIWPSTVG